jgi:nucleotide-binding universal stress UspA family protein
MVPKSGDYTGIGRCIAVGWNHSRQSAAALHGALPLIGKADRIVVLQGAERDPMPSVTKRPEADIAAYLRLHAENVSVSRIVESGKGSGADLQKAALEAGADLLVMGAYGRSAWREFVFGGTTRDVMQQLRLPVLMAH